MRYLLLSTIVPILLSAATCRGGKGGDAAASLQDTTWYLAGMQIAGIRYDIPPKVMLQLESGDRFNGFAGCNRYFGSYKLNGTDILFERIGATRRMCRGSVAKFESDYLSALRQVVSFRLTGDSLVLPVPPEGKLTYALTPPPAGDTTRTKDKIAGPVWRLRYLLNGDAREAPPADADISFQIDGDKAYGNGGCNYYSATAEVGPQTIAINHLISTRKYCGEISKFESRFFDALRKATGYRLLKEKELVIAYPGGELMFAKD